MRWNDRFARLQARAHSAHIGQEIEVHYRWHPLYGRRVKVRDVEERSGGRVVHVEAGPGIVRVMAAWMLDRAVCSAMELGEPRVTVAALCGLHRLLVDRRLRAHSSDGFNIVREKRNGQAAKERSSTNAIASGDAAPDEHEVRQRRTSGNERGAARKGDHASCEPADTSRGRHHREGV
jgi:hypothetical protein